MRRRNAKPTKALAAVTLAAACVSCESPDSFERVQAELKQVGVLYQADALATSASIRLVADSDLAAAIGILTRSPLEVHDARLVHRTIDARLITLLESLPCLCSLRLDDCRVDGTLGELRHVDHVGFSGSRADWRVLKALPGLELASSVSHLLDDEAVAALNRYPAIRRMWIEGGDLIDEAAECLLQLDHVEEIQFVFVQPGTKLDSGLKRRLREKFNTPGLSAFAD